MSCAKLCCISDLLLKILLYLNEMCLKRTAKRSLFFFAYNKEYTAEARCFAIVCASVVCQSVC